MWRHARIWVRWDRGRKGCGTYVSQREERAVKEENDAEEHEEPPERRQCNSDFCRIDKRGEPCWEVAKLGAQETHFDRL